MPNVIIGRSTLTVVTGQAGLSNQWPRSQQANTFSLAESSRSQADVLSPSAWPAQQTAVNNISRWRTVRRPRSQWDLAGCRGTSQRSNLGPFRLCDLWRINLTAYVRKTSETRRRQIRCTNITNDYCPNQGIELAMRCR